MSEHAVPDPDVVVCPSCGRRNRLPGAADGVPRCANCQHALPWIVDADDTTFGAVADAADLPVLVDLWATWCGPCRMVTPALVALARSHAGQVKLVKVDVDRAPLVAQRFAVQSVPTLIVLHRGEVVDRQAGAAPEHVLRPWLEEAIRRTSSSPSSTED